LFIARWGVELFIAGWGVELFIAGWGVELFIARWGVELFIARWGVELFIARWGVELFIARWGVELFIARIARGIAKPTDWRLGNRGSIGVSKIVFFGGSRLAGCSWWEVGQGKYLARFSRQLRSTRPDELNTPQSSWSA
jgi:hypothetical protein